MDWGRKVHDGLGGNHQFRREPAAADPLPGLSHLAGLTSVYRTSIPPSGAARRRTGNRSLAVSVLNVGVEFVLSNGSWYLAD